MRCFFCGIERIVNSDSDSPLRCCKDIPTVRKRHLKQETLFVAAFDTVDILPFPYFHAFCYPNPLATKPKLKFMIQGTTRRLEIYCE